MANKMLLFIAIATVFSIVSSEKFVFPESDEMQTRFSYGGGFSGRNTGVKTKTNYQPQDFHKLQSGYGKPSYTKTTSYYSSYGVDPGLIGSGESIERQFSGRGCSFEQIRPMNAAKRCSQKSCVVTCMTGYLFPNRKQSMTVTCSGNEWTFDGSELKSMPACEPVCEPQCQNNGICIAPGECRCPDNYLPPYCQEKKIVCLNAPPLAANSRRVCDGMLKSCKITCNQGYKFPDGSNQTNLQCLNGQWVSNTPGWVNVPDCKATCSPPCLNGGKCLSLNTCQCAEEFRGPQCQYSVQNCNPKKINFNGGYNCQGSGDSLSCTIFCPDGVRFEFPPESSYVCNYAVGKFLPERIPKCVFGANQKVIPQSQSSKTTYQLSNQTIAKKGGKQYYQTEEAEEGEGSEEVFTEIKTTVIRKKSKKKSYGYYLEDDEGEEQQISGVYVMSLSQDVDILEQAPKSSMCMTWNGMKVKTFDSLVYDIDLFCTQTLVQDINGEFAIFLRACPYDAAQPCPHALEVFMQNEQFTFEKRGNRISFTSPKKAYPIPVQLSGIKVTRSGNNIVISLDAWETVITWDTYKMVSIDASVTLWNRTAGLCGNMDGDIKNEFRAKGDSELQMNPAVFVESWRNPDLDKDKAKCSMEYTGRVMNSTCPSGVEAKATQICNKLLKNAKMKDCISTFNVEALLKTCVSDYCTCKVVEKRQQCACNGIAVLAKDCQYQGIKLTNGWRDMEICPMECTNGRTYMPCGPTFEKSCGSTVALEPSGQCREGCFCPNNKVFHNGTCIELERCPCRLRNKEFAPGAKIQKDCNICACESGEWKCSDLNCGARCSAIGDPHYVTFDGKHYSFMGKCSYYLLKTEDVTIEAENVACPGTISKIAGYTPAKSNEMPSCTKSVTIKFRDGEKIKTIKLNQGMQIMVEDLEITTLPKKMMNGLLKIKMASETFVIVDFHGGLKVWWDGQSRVYIDAPASMRGKTQGLCGTFNANQQDDFFTPEGDVETAIAPFADKWRTKESCPLMADAPELPHPCTLNLAKKEQANTLCSKLTASVFDECNWLVDHETFYADCMYDTCACHADPSVCACPIISSYAAECARQGNVLDWRQSITECGVKCPAGQIYEQCGDACSRTCDDLQSDDCRVQCVEGCRCPYGQALDEHNKCVPINRCGCMYKGLKFKSGYKEVRPTKTGLDLCLCSGAQWLCEPAKKGDAEKYPAAADIQSKCLALPNEEFTPCEPAEVLTCKNMHIGVQSSTPAECQPGCVCKKGFVLDTMKKKCVLPNDCSCHHGGRSFNDGEKMQEECNTCTCKSGSWSCTNRTCAGTCSAWGDSHFETFDGKDYDFQGVCTYVLSKGSLPDGTSYSITIQNVLCGSFGVTCTKSVEFNFVGQTSQTVKLTEDMYKADIKQITSNEVIQSSEPKPLFVYQSGVFIIVVAPGLGLQLKWDRGTRIYIKLDSRWKNRVEGLCGNYNNNALDDFKTPSSGLESNALIFGHSWKLQNFCEMPTEQANACEQQPHRKIWSQRQCGILKTGAFSKCHSEVPVESFLKRCVFDACACDQGGDCECLCTALAAYAHACAMRNVVVKWRTPELCPMQCDRNCSSYQPCISPCAVETCDNWLYQGKDLICKDDSCVEGCGVKACEEGMIYRNDSLKECVPKSVCKPVCLIKDGVTYYEGDVMKSDACHTCLCAKGKEKCSGVPCTTEPEFELFTPVYPTTPKSTPRTTAPPIQIPASPVPPIKYSRPLPEPESEEGQLCDPSVPHVAFPGDCTKFQHCAAQQDGSFKYAVKNCAGSTMYNPDTMVCDWPARVIAIKPECGQPGTIRPDRVSPDPDVEEARENGVCKPSDKLAEYRGDCEKYLECVSTSTGTFQYATKTCGPTMMFNPKTKACDKPATVKIIKPECLKPPASATTPGAKIVGSTTPKSPAPGTVKPGGTTAKPNISTKQPDTTDKTRKPVLYPDPEVEEANERTVCNPSVPHVEYPGDCFKFKHCVPTANGTFVYAIKTCGPSMMYNPNAMVCDWPAVVIAMKPSCGIIPPTSSTPSQPKTEKPRTKTTLSPKQAEKLIDICDKSLTFSELPGDCTKFKHCVYKDGVYQYVLKSCDPPKLFNPKTKSCDTPDVVKGIKPACDVAPAPITQQPILGGIVTTTTTTAKPWKPVVYPDPDIDYAHETPCDPSGAPHVEFPGDCHKFKHCMPQQDGTYKYAIKTCGDSMMYNPISMVCDWPAAVMAIKPDCGAPSTSKPSVKVPTTKIPKPVIVPPVEITEEMLKSECKLSEPYTDYPNDCNKFRQCVQMLDGSYKYTIKTCAANMYYNPVAMVCDWPTSVIAMKPECDEANNKKDPATGNQVNINRNCPPGTVWSACAAPCGRACDYYGKVLKQSGDCLTQFDECKAGCIQETFAVDCPAGQMWRDGKTCVNLQDCTCMSNDGSMVKPNIPYKESECKKCQCVDNAYVCMDLPCAKSTESPILGLKIPTTPTPLKVKPGENATTYILPTTVAPLLRCPTDRLVPLIDGDNKLPDTAFSAASTLSPKFKPEFSRLDSKTNGKSSGSWSPAINDQMQYLQITFPTVTPIYGVIMRGNSFLNQFVTSFKILHSFDGVAFHYLYDESRTPQIFRGPADSNTKASSLFEIPIEAKAVRIYPIAWHKSIAIRAELLGCALNVPTTTNVISSTTTPASIVTTKSVPVFPGIEDIVQPMCDDPMGVDNGQLAPTQIKVSSSKPGTPGVKTAAVPLKPHDALKLTAPKGWQPILDTPNEFVVFDFLEPRNLTGVKTKGGNKKWVTAYNVLYSKDNKVWNKILTPEGEPKEFLANVDPANAHINHFQKPIRAQYLKVAPVKWHEGIEMHVEPLGCFKPYPEAPEPDEPIVPVSNCPLCKGVLEPKSAQDGICPCNLPYFWNGQECLPQEDCPCIEGHMPYAVGSHYEREEDCSECVCTLGGVASCKPKACDKCPKGLRTVHTTNCACKCEPCPPGQLLCPTSQACILEELWCDNFEDCPDDEVNCVEQGKAKITEETSVTTVTTIKKTCPTPKCPPGFRIREMSRDRNANQSPMFQSGVKGRPNQGAYGSKTNPNSFKNNLPKPIKLVEAPAEKCIEFVCIPEQPTDIEYATGSKVVTCAERTCPKGYEVVEDAFAPAGPCPKFKCKPLSLPDAVCNVTGRTFNTFDGTEFKYDICDHVLARDLSADKWSLTMRKICGPNIKTCTKYIVIVDKPSNFIMTLFPNMTLDLNGFKYTVEQMQKSPTKKTFAVSKVGRNLIFVSHAHDFSVSMDKFGDVKLGLSSKLIKTVDGLCGYYSGKPDDDKRKPSGDLAHSTLEFGDSWLLDEKSKDRCEPHVCPKHLQDLAWNMCNAVKGQTFQKCGKVIEADRFVSKCIETACECLQSSTNPSNSTTLTKDTPSVKACKCSVLENYVTECMANDESIQLDTWRSAEDCEVKCAAPLVYKDCYRRRCEPSCDNIKTDDCPRLPGSCFPGCYCPEGLVKNGKKCTPPSECRDCVCDGLSKAQYLTYDRRNFTVDGNCTYLLTRKHDLDNLHPFQVYTTIGPCAKSSKTSGTCTQALHIIYGSHIVHIQRGIAKGEKPKVLIDGVATTTASWLKLTEEKGMFYKLVIPESQLEIVSSFDDMTFTIKVPSSKYSSKMEGLCGDCNGDPDDDLKPNMGKLRQLKPTGNAVKDFTMSWQSDAPQVTGSNDECVVEDVTDCMPLPPDRDPCFKILDEALFSKCHLLVDPTLYVSACQQDLCKLGPNQKGACNTMAAYARECARNGICLSWRKEAQCQYDDCPANLVYDACGCSKTCEMVKKHLAQSAAFKGRSPPAFTCPIDKAEGCYCPKGKLLHNGKCIADAECNAPCDNQGHLPGDVWYPDKCTECKCNNATKTVCLKKDCATKETICASGMTPLEVTKPEDCCKQFICVITSKPTPVPLLECQRPQVPVCTDGQTKKTIVDPITGCHKIICECKPTSECPPLQQYTTPLKPGMKKAIDTTGCCPTAKLVCDKSQCPAKPKTCKEALFEVASKPATPDSCCDEWECVSPKDMCVVPVNGTNLMKAINEKWPTADPCWSKVCAYGPDGRPAVTDEKQMCSVKCDPDQKYVVDDGKCCGICVPDKCTVKGKLYNPGEVWQSADNCTTFKCEIVDKNIQITSQQETCPDISKCPPESQYKQGCCVKCKLAALEKQNCLPEAMPEKLTVGLVRKVMGGQHGLCKNIVPIQGFTECAGSCASGSKYNPDTFQQEKKCDCCSVSAFKELDISLICEDGYVFKKKISVPSSCSCLKCADKLDTNNLS